MGDEYRYASEQFHGHNNVFVGLVESIIGTDDAVVLTKHDKPTAVVLDFGSYLDLLDAVDSQSRSVAS